MTTYCYHGNVPLGWHHLLSGPHPQWNRMLRGELKTIHTQCGMQGQGRGTYPTATTMLPWLLPVAMVTTMLPWKTWTWWLIQMHLCTYIRIICSDVDSHLTGTHPIFLHTSSKQYFISARGRSPAMPTHRSCSSCNSFIVAKWIVSKRCVIHATLHQTPRKKCVSSTCVCTYLLYPKRDDSTRSSSQTERLVLPACMHMYVFH